MLKLVKHSYVKVPLGLGTAGLFGRRRRGSDQNLHPAGGLEVVLHLDPPLVADERIRERDLERLRGTRVQGMFDVYNLFNASAVTLLNTRYGPTWLQPQLIMGARLFKFGVQMDF